MSRALSPGLTAMLAGGGHTRCTMLRFDLWDGTVLALTDHDRDIAFDLGDGEVTYAPRSGILPSDLQLSSGFTADDFEVTGPIRAAAADGVTATHLLGGRYDDARVRLFQIDWSAPDDGAIKLMQGRVVHAEVLGSRFKFLIHSEISRFAQQIGSVLTPYCDADFGDTRCGYSVPVVSATVTSVTDARGFALAYSGSFADDFFNRGSVTFTSGALAGVRPVEVFDFASAGAGLGSVALFDPLPEAPEVGDTLDLRIGCLKIARSDDAAARTCMFYENMVNFRGFPDVPGSDQVLPAQIPSA